MKFKVNPEDFRVEEKINLKISDSGGAYRVYRLTKRNWNTIDAVRAACEAAGAPFESARYCGRKDRLALTTQFITTPSGTDISFKRQNVSVEQVGFSDEPASPRAISGNMFTVTLRDMTEREAEAARSALAESVEKGFVNYFDDQRFGAGHGAPDGFFAELIVKRQYDRAVRMLLCNCHPDAPAAVKKRKRAMAENWGNWGLLSKTAADGNERAICDSLLKDSAAPGLLRILRSVPREEFGMYLSAYQSFIWNEVCSEMAGMGDEPAEIPTIAASILPAPERVLKAIHGALAKRGVRQSKLKISEFKERGYFASFMRPVRVCPEVYETALGEDELFRPSYKLTAKFLLPPGSYATMLLKHIAF